MQEEYQINQLDFDIINPNSTNYTTSIGGSKIVIIGKPGTGKSTLIKYLLYTKSDLIPVGICISGTEESNKFYSNFIPPLYIYNEYDEEIIKRFIMRQKEAISNKCENPWSFLLIDDCAEDKKIFTSKYQNFLYKNGRHLKFLYILSLQYANDIPPALRTSVDGIFLFRDTNENNLKKIYNNYAGIIPTYDLFKEYMAQVTGDYTALYIDNANQGNGEWSDHVYYFKVPDDFNNEVNIGCHEYKEHSSIRYSNNPTDLSEL